MRLLPIKNNIMKKKDHKRGTMALGTLSQKGLRRSGGKRTAFKLKRYWNLEGVRHDQKSGAMRKMKTSSNFQERGKGKTNLFGSLKAEMS